MSAMIRTLFIITCFVMVIQSQSQTLDWVNQFASSSSAELRAVVTDQDDNIYVSGYFDGTLDLDPGLNTFNISSPQNGDDDIFVAKYDSSGNFIWGFDVGDSLDQVSVTIQLKSSSELLIGGLMRGQADFDPSSNTNIVGSGASWNAYIASYSSTGNLNWVRSFESGGDVFYKSVVYDQVGNIYVAFEFKDSVDVNPGPAKNVIYTNNNHVSCLVKLNANGNYLWHHQFGDSGTVHIRDMALINDLLYLDGGFTKPFDLDPSTGTFILQGGNTGSTDRFLAEFDTSGSFHWGIWHSEIDLSIQNALILNGTELYSINEIDGTADFVPNDPSGLVSAIDGYGITRFDSGGIYDTTYLIEANASYFTAKVQSNGDWIVIGNFTGTPDISILGPSFQLNSSTGDGFFLASYDLGFELKNALMVESNNTIFPRDVNVDQSGNSIVVGRLFNQADFDPTLDTHYINSIGIFDNFMSKFGPCISQDTTDTLYICLGDSILIGDTYRDSAGTYNDTLRAFNSCDSIVAYTLIVYPEQSFSWWGDTIAACDGDSLFFHAGNTLTNSWTWHDGSTGTSWSGVFDHLNPIDSVSVTVGDINGCSHYGKVTLLDNTIDNFGAIVNSPQNPQASFSSVIPNEVDSFYWDFGDGTTLANIPSPNHQYTQFGSFEVCLYLFNECGMDSSCKTVEIGPVGIQSTENEQEIQIFPNPSKDGLFTLKTTQMGQLNIFDAQGKLLIQRQINAPQTTLDLQSYGSGVYLLELQLDNSILRRQLIVD